MAEYDKYYATDRGLLQNQLDSLPAQSEAEVKGLDAKLTQANDNILQGARGRGLGFSGIPIAEQAQYAATEYAPAVARVKQSQLDKQTGILGSLNSLALNQRTQAQSIFDNERNFEEQQRQFNEQMAAQRAAAAGSTSASAGDYLSQLLGGGGSQQGNTEAKMSQRQGGGFNFNIGGKAVSAATYAKATGTPFRTLLSQMAKAGDKGAEAALIFVGNDYGFDSRKINAIHAPSGLKNRDVYNSLTWGMR